MFTFLIFLLLSGLSFVIYVYYSNKIVSLRKQIILLTNQNNELRNKLSKLKEAETYSKSKETEKSFEASIQYDEDKNEEKNP